MYNEKRKIPVFLVEIDSYEDFERVLDESGSFQEMTSDGEWGSFPPEDRGKLSRGEREEQLCRADPKKQSYRERHKRYLLIDWINGGFIWGGDSDMRPLGASTPTHIAIDGKAISAGHYAEICRVLKKNGVPRYEEFVVDNTKEVRKILKENGFVWWNRPYFAMNGSTRTLLTIRPFTGSLVNAAYEGSKSIMTEAFIREYTKEEKKNALSIE